MRAAGVWQAIALALASSVAACESTTGPTGAQGTQGVAGVPGTNGINGTPGTNGKDGTPGTNGKDGAPGTNGKDGANGTNGTNGTNGADGSNGANGTNGSNGVDGAKGEPGTPGAKGDKGEKGDPADVAAAKGSINGTVVAAVGGVPLANVTIKTAPLALTATTAVDGTFKLANVPIGAYQLTLTKTGFTALTVGPFGVVSQNSTQVGAAMAVDAAAGIGPTIVVQNSQLAGYGQAVELAATVADPDGDASKLTFQWTQKAGPTVALTGDKTAKLSFKTLPLLQTKVVKLQRFGVLGLSPDDAGHYLFDVQVTDAQGHQAKTTVAAMAAAPNPGLRTVATGLPLYLAGDGAPQVKWAWTLDTAAVTGSTAALLDATSQYPHFTPDLKGTYKVTETVSGKSMNIYAGTWVGVVNAFDNCLNCHDNSTAADKFTPWQKTAHLLAAKAGFDGVGEPPPFGNNWLQFLTVGYSDFAKNGGFDDLAASNGWLLGTPAAGKWDALQKDKATVGKLAGVQCENCHGPQATGGHSSAGIGKATAVVNELKASRVSLSVQVCATCHQQAPEQYKANQWQTAAHANTDLTVHATWEGRGTTAAHCGRCHSAQGYVAYAAQLAKGNAGLLVKPDGSAADEAYLRSLGMQTATIEPQTCASCHNPHDATHPDQLRLFDTIAALPNGMTGLKGVGAGAVCMSCHNTRNGEHSDFVAAPTSLTGPHAPAQTDVMYGFNAYFMPRYTPSKHLAITDTCVACHVQIPTAGQALAKQASNHAFKPDKTVCASCHSDKVTGEALQGTNGMLLDDLAATAMTQVKTLVAAAQVANGKVMVRAWEPSLDVYSSAKDPNVDLAAAPTSVELTSIHGSLGFILHLPKAVAVTWTTGATVSVTDVYVAGGSLVTTPAGGAAQAIVAANSTVAKALWNYQLLLNDGTLGIHNPTFFQGVIAATKAALSAK